MFEFLKSPEDDAINLLKRDHDTVKSIFDEFEKTDSRAEKKKLVAKAIMELKIHATIEEETFYPALRLEQVDKHLINEADEEHHVAKLLIAELEQMNGSEDHYDAKFKVLSENIRHHIKEEENELFPQARKTKLDFQMMAHDLIARKNQLKKTGVPACAEEIMIFSHAKGSGDSPALTASRKKSPSKTKRIKAKARSTAKTPVKSKVKAAPLKSSKAKPLKQGKAAGRKTIKKSA